MNPRKRGTHKTDPAKPGESRAKRRRRERDARREVIPPRPVPEWRRWLEGRIRWLLKEAFALIAWVVLVLMVGVVIEKVSDPEISLHGTVVDEGGKGIEGATVEWSTSREGGFGRDYSGTVTTDERGRFYVSSHERRKVTRRGRSLHILRVSKDGYEVDDTLRTFRFHKDPERMEGGSSEYSLKRAR